MKFRGGAIIFGQPVYRALIDIGQWMFCIVSLSLIKKALNNSAVTTGLSFHVLQIICVKAFFFFTKVNLISLNP